MIQEHAIAIWTGLQSVKCFVIQFTSHAVQSLNYDIEVIMFTYHKRSCPTLRVEWESAVANQYTHTQATVQHSRSWHASVLVDRSVNSQQWKSHWFPKSQHCWSSVLCSYAQFMNSWRLNIETQTHYSTKLPTFTVMNNQTVTKWWWHCPATQIVHLRMKVLKSWNSVQILFSFMLFNRYICDLRLEMLIKLI